MVNFPFDFTFTSSLISPVIIRFPGKLISPNLVSISLWMVLSEEITRALLKKESSPDSAAKNLIICFSSVTFIVSSLAGKSVGSAFLGSIGSPKTFLPFSPLGKRRAVKIRASFSTVAVLSSSLNLTDHSSL